MSSPNVGTNYRKERLLHFGSSKNSTQVADRNSTPLVKENDDSYGALGIVLQGRIVQNIVKGSQAYFCKAIALKDEVIAAGESKKNPDMWEMSIAIIRIISSNSDNILWS